MSGDEEDIPENLYKIRHSLAHVMAQAVLQIRPGSKLGFGPPIRDGFYYDFILSSPITDHDFPEIEKKMKKIIAQAQKFDYEDLEYDAAMKRLDEMGEPYKKEYAQELFKKNNLKVLRFYTNGPFLDMCEGPHVDATSKIPKGAFKLRSVAGAYWRGDSDNTMMTRIYAWAFENREELDAYVKAFKEAQEKDHKKLGKELDIFTIDDEIGKGLPLWLPNGTIVRDEIEKYMVELEFRAGYQRVATPQLAKSDLYYRTGHLPYFKEAMFPFMEVMDRKEGEDGETEEVKETYCLRPMNCPHHHKVFAARKRSYRELPLRLAEYGQVFRFEDSGAVSGLVRVRGMRMNDAHIYCTEDQIEEEFLAVMRMHETLYKTLGLKDYFMRHSMWDENDPDGNQKYINDPAGWNKSQDIVRKAMKASGLPYKEVAGEAAFYGPKIDFQFRTVTGREETLSTNQLDFGVAARLGLKYVGADNEEHTPFIIHRAPASTHERFVAFLIEHFGGAFPIWLAPTQVRMITVSEKFNEYADRLVTDLRATREMIRAERDESSESLNKKIRIGTKAKIPNLIIIGEKEVESNTVTLRRYGVKEQKTMPFDEFKAWIQNMILERKLHSEG